MKGLEALTLREGSAQFAMRRLLTLDSAHNQISDPSPLRRWNGYLNRLELSGNPMPAGTACPLAISTYCVM